MTTPTRLTPEDLPTLRKLAAFWSERQQFDFTGDDGTGRGAARRWWRTLLAKAACHVIIGTTSRFILAIERTGHLASDERVDKDGRVSRL